jgi:hypothetical protein
MQLMDDRSASGEVAGQALAEGGQQQRDTEEASQQADQSCQPFEYIPNAAPHEPSVTLMPRTA